MLSLKSLYALSLLKITWNHPINRYFLLFPSPILVSSCSMYQCFNNVAISRQVSASMSVLWSNFNLVTITLCNMSRLGVCNILIAEAVSWHVPVPASLYNPLCNTEPLCNTPFHLQWFARRPSIDRFNTHELHTLLPCTTNNSSVILHIRALVRLHHYLCPALA